MAEETNPQRLIQPSGQQRFAITIIGKMEENKMAKGPSGKTGLVSERTLNAIRKLGIEVIDDENQYKF